MERKKISPKKYNFLMNEIRTYRKNDWITSEQESKMLSLYDVTAKNNFNFILLTIGALILGLGILLLIASNWQSFDKFTKLGMIYASYFGAGFGSYAVRENYPKTSKSLLYLSMLIFGGGIFLTGQMFHFGGSFEHSFLIWGAGTMAVAFIFRDSILYAMASLLCMIYVGMSFFNSGVFGSIFSGKQVTYDWIIAAIPLVILLRKRFEEAKTVSVWNNLLVATTVMYFTLTTFTPDHWTLSLWVLFGMGVTMYYIPFKCNRNTHQLIGTLMMGFAGMWMTFQFFWKECIKQLLNITGNGFGSNWIASLDQDSNLEMIVSVTFSIVLIAFFLYMLRKHEKIAPVVLICAVILRYYFDIAYGFMDKSIFFIVGGLLLIGTGIFIEKTKRNMRRVHEDGNIV